MNNNGGSGIIGVAQEMIFVFVYTVMSLRTA